MPVTHLARTLTSPHFIFRVAKEATQKKFSRFKGLSKRGGLVPRQLPRVKRVQVCQAAEEEEEAARHDSDMSVDSYPLELMNCP